MSHTTLRQKRKKNELEVEYEADPKPNRSLRPFAFSKASRVLLIRISFAAELTVTALGLSFDDVAARGVEGDAGAVGAHARARDCVDELVVLIGDKLLIRVTRPVCRSTEMMKSASR